MSWFEDGCSNFSSRWVIVVFLFLVWFIRVKWDLVGIEILIVLRINLLLWWYEKLIFFNWIRWWGINFLGVGILGEVRRSCLGLRFNKLRVFLIFGRLLCKWFRLWNVFWRGLEIFNSVNMIVNKLGIVLCILFEFLFKIVGVKLIKNKMEILVGLIINCGILGSKCVNWLYCFVIMLLEEKWVIKYLLVE